MVIYNLPTPTTYDQHRILTFAYQALASLNFTVVETVNHEWGYTLKLLGPKKVPPTLFVPTDGSADAHVHASDVVEDLLNFFGVDFVDGGDCEGGISFTLEGA